MTPTSPLVFPVLLATLAGGCLVPETWPGADVVPVAPGASAAGAIEGTVHDGSGAPVAGAWVTTDPGGVETTTDAAGAYLVPRLSPGTYAVVASLPGVGTGVSGTAPVGDGERVRLDVTLTPPPVVDGLLRVRVTGPDGLPFAGAEVQAGSGVVGSTDAEGRVTLSGLGGAVTDVVILDPAGGLWTRTQSAVAVPVLGGTDLAVSLTGHGGPEARYAGSDICTMCHADIGARWTETAHAQAMSELAGLPAEGFDAGEEIDLGGAVARLETVDGVPTVTLVAADGTTDAFTVAGLLGGERRGAVPWAERDGIAWPLPVAWVAPDTERADWDPGGWVAGDTAPWFTADGLFTYTSAPDPAASAEATCFGCHVTGYTLELGGDGGVYMQAATTSVGRWDDARVGCEACHGPGLDHTSGPLASKPFTITNPADLAPGAANEVCGQCHAALAGEAGTPYPWSATHGLFVPGESLADHATSAFLGWASGAAAIPGAELDELRLSRHGAGAWNARCDDCHDPHGTDLTADLRVDHADNALCLSCHLTRSFAGDEAQVTTHVAHVNAPTSSTESGRCTGCHMPETAARVAWNDLSAAGDLSSHRFFAIPPADSLAAFDAAGVDTLLPGEFVANACQDCHAWNDLLFEGGFPGPAGDMGERATHEALQAAYEVKYP